jgi:hypothetical protein
MIATPIRCLVIRIPDEAAPVRPQAAWREALPWADPYILGLIAKLQREVRLERAAQFMAERELNARIDDAVEEEIIDAEEFTAEEWNESIRTGPRKCK